MSEYTSDNADGKLTLQGTSRLNASGAGGSGTLTLPKHVTQPLISEYGKDYAVFSDGERVLIVPQSEVDMQV